MFVDELFQAVDKRTRKASIQGVHADVLPLLEHLARADTAADSLVAAAASAL